MTTNVLANDQSSSGTVAKDVGPTHGTATCTSAGSCTYTPTAGFVGYDGFRYTVTDQFGTATGTALITVVAANAGFDGAATGKATVGGGNSIAQGDSATWSIGAKGRPTFLPQQWATVNRPTVPVTLNGLHSLDPASVTTAAGWTATPSGGGLTLTAGPTALLGEATTNALPPPLPPISQGTGGDGHVPILVGTKVYTFFHHSYPTSVSCIDRETGGGLSRVPAPAGDQLERHHRARARSSGSRIYVSAYGVSFHAAGTVRALLLGHQHQRDVRADHHGPPAAATVGDPGVSAPRLVNGKLYFAGRLRQALLRRPGDEPALRDAVGADRAARGRDPGRRHLRHRDPRHPRLRLGDARSSGRRARSRASTSATGAAVHRDGPRRRTSTSRNLVNHHNAAGVADGVCAVNSTESKCVTDASTRHRHRPAGPWPIVDDYYSVSEEAELGTRTLFATGLGDSGMGCWDWTTNALVHRRSVGRTGRRAFDVAEQPAARRPTAPRPTGPARSGWVTRARCSRWT